MPDLTITSLTNPRVKSVVRLRQRTHRDAAGRLLIEGYREILRATEVGHPIETLFTCPPLFLGVNNEALIARCAAAGAELVTCSRPVFEKMAYRDRPDGLIAIAPLLNRRLESLTPPDDAFVVVAESIEKPGNLGTILRSCDAAGVDAMLVCDRCTDLGNPNVVRASVGTLFTVPVVETGTPEALDWLATRNIAILAATPHADALYTETDMTGPVAIVIGAEQTGLSDRWMAAATHRVRIPMLGRADSLNVATATTILLYEVVRQRRGQPA